jgi:hypothetical protein
MRAVAESHRGDCVTSRNDAQERAMNPQRVKLLAGIAAFAVTIAAISGVLHVSRSGYPLAALILATSLSAGGLAIRLGSGRVLSVDSWRAWTRERGIPGPALMIAASVFLANGVSIATRIDAYPFYSVAMFNEVVPRTNFPDVVTVEKYGYLTDGRIELLDLRREGSLIIPGVLGWRYGHPFTFAAAFHQKSDSATFALLQDALPPEFGRLFVVVQSHDFSTGTTSVDENLCAFRAIDEALYYGRLFVPPHQVQLCP